MKSGNTPIKQKRMILEKNAKTGELAFSKSFLLMFAVFDDLERVIMSSEVFLNANVAFLLPFLIHKSFNCLPDSQKNFQFT
jgi:hypothetical protein